MHMYLIFKLLNFESWYLKRERENERMKKKHFSSRGTCLGFNEDSHST